MELSKKEWRTYQRGLALFVDSDRYMCKAEFHTVMGKIAVEMQSALDRSVENLEDGRVELPDKLVRDFVSLLNQFVGYPFSKEEIAEIERELEMSRAEMGELKGELRVRLGLPAVAGSPTSSGQSITAGEEYFLNLE